MFLQAFQGKRGKIEAKKGESKTPLPYPLRKAGYSGYLCWCLGETFLGGAFEDDSRSSFYKEERLVIEQRLKNCRIAGPIFLAIGDFFWMTSTTFIVYTRTPRCWTSYNHTDKAL